MSGHMAHHCTEVPGEAKEIKVYIVVVDRKYPSGTETSRVDHVFSREWQAQKRTDWIEAHEELSHPRIVERFVHGLC